MRSLGQNFPSSAYSIYTLRHQCAGLIFDILLFLKIMKTMQIIVRRMYLSKYNIFKITTLLWVMIFALLEVT